MKWLMLIAVMSGGNYHIEKIPVQTKEACYAAANEFLGEEAEEVQEKFNVSWGLPMCFNTETGEKLGRSWWTSKDGKDYRPVEDQK